MSLLIGALAAAVAGATLNDQLEKFPIGFWNYAPIEVFDEAKIQEWQDAGMTLTMGPEVRRHAGKHRAHEENPGLVAGARHQSYHLRSAHACVRASAGGLCRARGAGGG